MSANKKRRTSNNWLQAVNKKPYNYFLLILIAFLFYANAVPNQYAMDDTVVIENNDYTKKGLEGIPDILTKDSFAGYLGEEKRVVQGGRYRPLSIITFAIEYEFFGESPYISHAINVLLYALIGVLIFLIFSYPPVLKRIKTWRNTSVTYNWKYLLPFVITLIYICHPIHTEAVDNIKGRDELFTFLFSLVALYFSLRYTERHKLKWLFGSFLFFTLGLFSKENTITFLAAIPLFLYVFTETSKRDKLITLIPLVVASIFFLVVRIDIVGLPSTEGPDNLMNNAFAEATLGERYATIFYTLLVYLKLLFFPHPLTVDYYPYHIPLINWGDIRALLPLLFYIGIGIYAIIRLRYKDVIAFCILYFFITISIVSNIVFSVGTFMSERFLFIPSLGFAIFSGYVLFVILPNSGPNKKYRSIFYKTSVVLTGIMILFFGTKTLIRNTQWEDNYTLFSHDVKISHESAFSNKSVGNHLIDKALDTDKEEAKKRYLQKAIKHLQKSVKIYPEYQKALFLAGNANYLYSKNFRTNHNNFERAFHYYGKLLNLDPDYNEVYKNIPVILRNVDDTQFKKKIWTDMYQINPERYEVNYFLGLLYRDELGDNQKALKHLRKATDAKPEKPDVWMDLGVVHGNMGNWEKAGKYHEKAVSLGLRNKTIFKNLNVIYKQLGNTEKAKKYQESYRKQVK